MRGKWGDQIEGLQQQIQALNRTTADHAHLLGKLPDRVVAEEAGMSLGAVRNYRIKNDIPAACKLAVHVTSRT